MEHKDDEERHEIMKNNQEISVDYHENQQDIIIGDILKENKNNSNRETYERNKCIVIDTGAIVKGETKSFHRYGQKFYTIQEVLTEVRDLKSRDILASLPFELEIKTPSDQAMHAVYEFAKKTGDFAALSLCDLKIIALTYDLEAEAHQQQFLRKAPLQISHAIPPKPQQVKNSVSKREPETNTAPESCCCEEQDYIIHDDVNHLSDQGLVHEVIDHLTALSIKEEIIPEDRTSSVETLDGSAHSAKRGGSHLSNPSGARDVLENCSVESIDGSSHANSDQEIPLEEIIEIQTELETQLDLQPKVRFEDTQPEPNHVELPIFDEENFPTLGDSHVPSAPVSTGNSWAKKLSTSPAEAPITFSHAPKGPSKSYVIPPSTARPDPLSQEVETTIPTEVSSSRIISTRGGVGDYVSKAASSLMASEDDGVGWINPSNLPSCRATGEGMLHSQSKQVKKTPTETTGGDEWTLNTNQKKKQKNKPKPKSKNSHPEAPLGFRNQPLPDSPSNPIERLVGCMTTDYAMQNVMLQMGLQVISLDGNIIRQVKQWVLRCAGCYQIHYDMSRLFCSNCGLNMLQRISASIDSQTGQLRLHLKKNYIPNRRGQVYSLPAPGKQDRFEGEILLREDQLLSGIWKQKVVKINKDVRSAFGEDITSDVGLQINKGTNIKVGLGKRNPNAEKGRERRGKRKQKK